jgi:hypothetical protein
LQVTDGWLSQWKSKHDIKLNKSHSMNDSADAVSAGHWKSTKLPILLQKRRADDIYSAEETDLSHHATPDGTLSCKDAIL